MRRQRLRVVRLHTLVGRRRGLRLVQQNRLHAVPKLRGRRQGDALPDQGQEVGGAAAGGGTAGGAVGRGPWTRACAYMDGGGVLWVVSKYAWAWLMHPW